MTALLDFDLRTAFFELLLDRIGFFLGHPGLDRLRRALHEVLGFLQAETRELTHHLNDLDFRVGRCRSENDVECRFLFGRSSRSTARSTGFSLVGLSLAILAIYSVMNALTKGYFRARLRASAGLALALGTFFLIWLARA